jgi:acyl-CoA thioesterase
MSGGPGHEHGFDSDTSLTAAADGGLRGEITERWRAATGPHGGYLAALILRGLTMVVADPSRPPLTLTIQFVRQPAFGPVEFRGRIERTGRSLTSVSAGLIQDDEPVALALATYAVQMTGLKYEEPLMPRVEAPWPDRRSLLSERAPPFTHNLVLQPRFGFPFFRGRPDPMIAGGWTGLPDRRPLDALALALFSDAWFPPPYVRLDQFVPCPTVTLSVYFRTRLPLLGAEPDDLCLAQFETQLVRDGHFESRGTIWAQDGTVLAQSHQLQLLLSG